MLKAPNKPTKKEKLLDILSDHEWHSTKELVRRVGHTFATAKRQLIAYGYNIVSRIKTQYRWEYRLKDEDDN